MTRHAVAYIRRSSGKESQVSLQTQTETVERLAEEHDQRISNVYQDWGRSGGSEDRPRYLQMLADVEAGNIGTIYAFDQDRLARDNWIFASLLRVAERHDVHIITTAGDLTNDDRRDFAEMRGVVDGGALRKIRQRNRANRDHKQARGDDMGEAPYGYSKVRACDGSQRPHGPDCGAKHRHTLAEPVYHPETGDQLDPGACYNVKTDPDAILTVLNAYAAAGSALGAARLLNAAGHPTKRGREWNNRGVKEIVEREAPELLPARMGRKHARHYRTRTLSGVLRCRCGTTLSPNGSGWTCRRGSTGAHSKPYNVEDSIVLPWVRAEADRLAVPYDSAEDAGDEGERERLEARRQKLIDLYLDDTITKADMDAKMHDLDAKVAALEARAGMHDLPRRIDWDGWSPSVINDVLRSLFVVELGEDMRPVRAVWAVPKWRGSGRAKPRQPRRRGRLDAIRARVTRT